MKLWIAVHDPGSGSLFGMQTFVRRPLSTNKRKTNIWHVHFMPYSTVKLLSQFWLTFNTCFISLGLEVNFMKVKVCVCLYVAIAETFGTLTYSALIIIIPVKWVDKLSQAEAKRTHIVMVDNFNISNSVCIASVASLFAKLIVRFGYVALSGSANSNNNNSLLWHIQVRISFRLWLWLRWWWWWWKCGTYVYDFTCRLVCFPLCTRTQCERNVISSQKVESIKGHCSDQFSDKQIECAWWIHSNTENVYCSHYW